MSFSCFFPLAACDKMYTLEVLSLAILVVLLSQVKTLENSSSTQSKYDENRDIFKEFWEWRLLNAPEFATFVGVYKYDDRLDEMSLNSYVRRKEAMQLFLERANKLPASQDLELLKSEISQFIAGQRFKSYLWPMNILEGPQLDFPRLLSWMKKNTTEDLEKIMVRMRGFSQQIDESITLMKEGIRIGLTMHNISIEPLPEVLKKMAEEKIENSRVFKPFTGKRPKGISDGEWRRFIKTTKSIIKNVIQPSYLRLASFIKEEYLSHTRPDIGAYSLPKGRDYYTACLKYHTTTNLTANQIHEVGLHEVRRITKRLEKVKEAAKFNGTLEAFRNYLRDDPQFNYSKGEEIVDNFKQKGKHIHSLLTKLFSVLPKAPYVIVPLPLSVAPSFPGAFYLSPSKDGRRPGTFFVNTYKPETRKRYEAVALSLHEAEPGHHLQGALSIEHGSPLEFRRFMEDRKYYEAPSSFAKNTAYIEGWGLYAEFLGEELGVYSNHYDMAGRLSHEMFRACRLVVDTGMHAFRWSRDKAINYLQNNTALGLHDIEKEVDRYITWPGQACGYKIGEIKLKALRKRAKKALGDKFDLRDYHTTVASMGGVPLHFLEKQIDKYIKEHV